MNLLLESEKLPVMDIPRTRMEIILEVISVLGLLIIGANIALMWPVLPDRVPTHFGASGIPDAWGGKTSLFLLPVITFFMYGLMTMTSRYPQFFNYPWKITEQNIRAQYLNSRQMITSLKAGIICLFTYSNWRTMQVALGKANGLGTVFLIIFLTTVFGILGYYLYKGIKLRK
jgi:uncharacterized membrane protein